MAAIQRSALGSPAPARNLDAQYPSSGQNECFFFPSHNRYRKSEAPAELKEW